MRRVQQVAVKVHPSMYNKIEELRKFYQDGSGIKLSQTSITNIIARNINIPKLKKLDLIGGTLNVKKKR